VNIYYLILKFINKKGEIISSYKEDVPRLPASNQKLLSSAYVLIKYKLIITCMAYY